MTTEAQEKKVNDFMVENADKITVKDIKYSIWSPNPHQILNLSVDHRSVINCKRLRDYALTIID